MIKCQHCGRNIPYDANLCPYCGRSIKQFQQKDILEPEKPEEQKEQAPEQEMTYQPPKPKNDRKFLFFVLAVLALLLVAGLVYRSSLGDDEEDEPKAVASDTVTKAAAASEGEKTKSVTYNSKETQYVVVNGDGVRLRFGPSLKHDYLKNEKGGLLSVKKGTRLVCTGEKADWYQVEFQGKRYYMSKQYTYLVE